MGRVGWTRIGSFRGRRLIAAGAIATILFTAGCGQSNPSVVAYVGSDGRVTQSELDAAMAGLAQTLQPGQTVLKSAVVSALIQGEIAQQVAAANNITITDADRDTILKGSNLAALLTVPDAKVVAYDVADSQIVPSKVGSAKYLQAVQATPVELNPRFGQLNPTDKTIVDGSTGSLSTPLPVAGG